LTPEILESLIDLIYAAGEDPRHWPAMLAALTSHLSAVGGGLFAGAGDKARFSLGVAHGFNPVRQAAYADYYHRINPLNAGVASIPVGAAAADHHLLAPRLFTRSEFYNDFAKPCGAAGSMTLVLSRDHRQTACLGLLRPSGSDPFTDEQVAFVRRLGPHIRRAVDLNRRFAGQGEVHDGLETALDSMQTAVFVLDETGVVRYCSAAGEKLLRQRDGLRVEGGRLCADDMSAQDRLAGLLRNALTPKGARGGFVAAPRRCSARPLLVRVMPVMERGEFWLKSPRRCAIVFAADPDAAAVDAVDEAAAAYGLTNSEKSLLSELVAGRSLKDAAANLSIARATSRNRLARIMAKTDTHRQSELIQLILRSVIPLR
jgi:DNA-binding CsgD family transcriptional regulator